MAAVVPTSLDGLKACECLELYRRRPVSHVEVVDGCLSRIDANNPTLNAFHQEVMSVEGFGGALDERRASRGSRWHSDYHQRSH